MSLNVNINDGTFILTVSGDMTVSSLLDIKESILEGISGVQNVEIDLSGVEDMDSAGFQVLYAIKKYAEANKLHFRLSAYSRSVLTYMDTYNMHDHFKTDQASLTKER